MAGITSLIKGRKGQLLCGTAERMCLSLDVSVGSPLSWVLEGDLFGWSDALVSGKRYRWVLSHSLEALSSEGGFGVCGLESPSESSSSP